MELCGIILLTLATSVRAQIDLESVSASLYYSYTRDSKRNVDIFNVNSVPFLFFDFNTRLFVVNGRVTDGLKELGRDEVTFYTERARDFSARLQVVTEEMINLTNGTPIASKKPVLHVYTKGNRSPGQADILYCYAEKFYPFEIEVSFLINGRPFVGQVNSSQLVVEPDWTFNILKYIRMERRHGDTYSCRVNHISLPQPLTESLDPPPRQLHTGTIVCAVGVIVGAVGFVIGLSLVVKIRARQGQTSPRQSGKE
ncbi:class II histocompatibility antigen, B-L beta chain-like [Hemiscyllium ocellatum]|uniref:class II histocompatibility antigen, B-L beta chain-like n=1 Tax=Hemiscyllium ocellatum TaxID=170820 RepID=UPI002966B3FC|nr:class II histocompatibility antigen, B-L beta chain-like [Hemiscyllium ocellatum]